MNSRHDDLELPGDTGGNGPLATTGAASSARLPDPATHLPPGAFAAPSGTQSAPGDLQRRVMLAVLAGVSGLALGALALLATKNGEGNVGWLALLIVLGGALFLLARNFEAGVVLFLGVCWMRVGTPEVASGGSGGGQRLLLSQAGLFILLVVWIARRFAAQDFRFYRMPVLVPMGLFLLVCTWSTMNSLLFPDPQVMAHSFKQYTQVNILEIGIRFLALGATVMIANTLHGRFLRWGAGVLLLPGLAAVTGISLVFGASSYLAFAQTICIGVCTAFALNGRGPSWLRAVAGLIAISLVGVMLLRGAEWVSGWLAGIMALGLVAFLAQRRVFWIGCAVLAVLVIAPRWNYFYQSVYVSNFKANSLRNDRTDMLRGAALYATHFPLGIGVGNYRQYNQYYADKSRWDTGMFSSAHGTISQALSETGFLGLLALLLLLGSLLFMTYRVWRALPPGSWESHYTLGALGALAGVFAAAAFNGDYVFPTYHNGGMATFGATVYTFFLAGVVGAIAREHKIVWGRAPQQAEAIAPAAQEPAQEAAWSARPGGFLRRPAAPARGAATAATVVAAPLISRPLRGAGPAAGAPAGEPQRP